MTDKNRSPLAAQVGDLHDDLPRGNPVFGLAVHCSGRGIVEQARKLGVDPIEHAIAYYRSAECSCHYVIGYDGTIVQITADDRRVPHVGVAADERQLYLSGRWMTDRRLASSAVARWHQYWATDSGYGFSSPQHLFPSSAPNADYVGAELSPLEKPRDNGLWYTDEQHQGVAELADDLRRRHGWPAWWTEGALPCPRLLGHEDLDAFGRWDAGGGWDPGALRAVPRFSWLAVQALLR